MVHGRPLTYKLCNERADFQKWILLFRCILPASFPFDVLRSQNCCFRHFCDGWVVSSLLGLKLLALPAVFAYFWTYVVSAINLKLCN